MKKEEYIQLERKIDSFANEKKVNLGKLNKELTNLFDKIKGEEESKRK